MDLTYPHDYRVISGGDVMPTIVGGQAVNIWAIAMLEAPEHQALCMKYGSGDMDVLSAPKVLDHLRTLPNWQVDKVPLRFFNSGLDAIARSFTPDGRRLLVEVLKGVKGLDGRDLEATDVVDIAGTRFKVLDPVALLKAKASCVRDLDQVGPPPRHDVDHLKLVARCLPRYLAQAHEFALSTPASVDRVNDTFSRTFAALQDRKTREGLLKAGLVPHELVPDLSRSPIAHIRNAYFFQMPRVRRDVRGHER